MNLSHLDDKTIRMEALRALLEKPILSAIRSKVEDAHAHAVKALTDRLKATQDGRSTLTAINRSPSFTAGLSRLDELLEWLCGPSSTSLTGKIRDAREKLYIQAAELWWPLIPTNLKSRSTVAPNKMQLRRIRAAAIHGYDPRTEMQAPIETAKRTLKAAVEQAARRSTPGHIEADLLSKWAASTTASITRTATSLLNDSCEYADRLAGRELIAPEFIEEETA